MNPPKVQVPFRIAIIGSGPSGFYAADALLTSPVSCEIDIFERLPAPFGLVRYGVAPDHPKIKNVIKVYDKIASNPRVAYFGNVEGGRDLTIDELRQFYDAVILCCGAETDRPLGLPNENWPGSHTATEFVGWYNGHPDYQNRHFDLSHPTAVIIGTGNVAMDVARILAKTPEELAKTDITQEALAQLSQSKIREIHIVGRRGPVQAAFTPVEIKEFSELTSADVIVNKDDLILNETSQLELDDPKVPVRKKNFEILQKYTQAPTGKPRKVFFHFKKSPKEIKGNGKVMGIVLEKNTLFGEPGQQSSAGTGIMESIDCGLIFRSVGYHGVAIPGVPFEAAKGVFPNLAGRVVDTGKVIPGLYTSGWIKRGPSGIIGTNKADSDETVKNLLADIESLPQAEFRNRSDVEKFLQDKKVRHVTYADWRKIDQVEIERGQLSGKPREKFTAVEEMLKTIGK